MKTNFIQNDLKAVCLLFIVSTSVALGLNQLKENPVSYFYVSPQSRLDKAVQRFSCEEPLVVSYEIKKMDLPSFEMFVKQGSGIILDVRQPLFFEMGHVPRAMNLPKSMFEETYQNIRYRLETSRNAPLVIYCSGESCEDSQRVAAALVKLGYSNVTVFPGGWDAWNDAGMPSESAK